MNGTRPNPPVDATSTFYNVTHETRFFSCLASSNWYPGQDANPISKKRQQTVFWKWFYYISSVRLFYLVNLTFTSRATPASRYTDENKQDDRNAVTWPFCTVTVYLRFLAVTRPWRGSTNRQEPELHCITNLNRNRRSSGLLILTCEGRWPPNKVTAKERLYYRNIVTRQSWAL